MTETKVQVPPLKITLTEAFLEITKYDWVSINFISPQFLFLIGVRCGSCDAKLRVHGAKPPLSHVFPWHAQGCASEQLKSILRVKILCMRSLI